MITAWLLLLITQSAFATSCPNTFWVRAYAQLPETVERFWNSAPSVYFPLDAATAISQVDLRDIAILRALSLQESFYKTEPTVGWVEINGNRVFVEAVHHETSAWGRELLLNVAGRRYRIALIKPPVWKDPQTVYRLPANDLVNKPFLRPILELKTADPKWLYGSDAKGVSVQTRTGHVFSRVDIMNFSEMGTSWKDEETGLIWSEAADQQMNQAEAEAFCKSRSGQLPSSEMIREFSAHDGQDLLREKQTMKYVSISAGWQYTPHSRWYWLAPEPGFAPVANYSPVGSRWTWIDTRPANAKLSVICVSR